MAVSKGFELATLGSGLDVNQSTGEVVTINLDTDVVSEGSVNLYYTDERVDDRVSNLLVEGTGITLSYDDGSNTLTINGQSLIDSTNDVQEGTDNSVGESSPGAGDGTNNLYYTDARVDAYVSGGSLSSVQTTGNIIVGGNLTVNGTSTTINSTELAVDDLNITIASGAADAAAANGAGITVDGANATLTYNGVNDYWVFNKEPYYNALRLLTTDDLTGTDNYAFKTIAVGATSAVADSNTDTFTIAGIDQIEAVINPATDTLTLGHVDSGVTDGSYGSSTAIPVIEIDAQGHITSASTTSISTSWTINDGTTSQQIAGGDTLTIIDGADIDATVSATDQLTIANTSTLQSVTGRGNTTTNSIGIGTNSITSGYTFDVNGTSFFRDATTVQDTAFTTAYNSVTGLVIDSTHIDGSAAGYGNSISFTSRNVATAKKAAIALYQQGTDADDVNLRFFVSSSNIFTDPVTLALELQRGGQVKVSNAYTLPTADGTSNQVLTTNGSGVLSFTTPNTLINWNVPDNYAFTTVVAGSTSLVADSNADTLTISAAQTDSTTGIVVTGNAATDAITIAHADTSSVTNLTSAANTFIAAQTYDTYGHVLTRTTGTIDFDVAANYAYKFMTDGTNTSEAASNTDTFTFTNGTDTTAVVNAANDSVTFNNTSTLDSVTDRGNTTTNSITVGDATVNGNLTVNGTTTTLDTTNLLVEDPVIVLAKNQSTPASDTGFVFQRYSSPTTTNYNTTFFWDEVSDKFIWASTAETGADNDITPVTNWMTLTNAGRLGIGFDTPTTALDVNGVIRSVGNPVTGDGATLQLFNDNQNTTNYGWQIQQNEDASLAITVAGTGGAELQLTSDGADHTTARVRIGNGVQLHSSDISYLNGGNVGIGITNPQTLLHLARNNDGVAANNTLRFEDVDAGAAVNQQLGLIEFYGNDTSTGSSGQKAYIGAFAESLTPQAYLAFATDGTTGTATERMRITSNGYVGVGTTDPQWHTHVYGSGAGTIRSMVENGSTGQASVDLKNSEGHFRLITDDGRYYIYDQGDGIIRFNISTTGAITFNDAFTFPTADGSASQALITDGSGNLSFGSLSTAIDWNVAANYAFQTIATPAGTNPVADSNTDTLTLLNGADISITGSSVADSVTIANTSTLQTVTDRGASTTNNVGIGTNADNSKLRVVNNVDTNTDWWTNGQATLRLQNLNANGNPVLKFESSLSRIVYGLGGATDKLIFSSRQSTGTTSEVITFNNDGEVGIGTVDPLARMHIGPFNGGSASPHLLLTSSNNAFGWRIDTQDFGSGDVPLRIWRRNNSVDTELVTIQQDGAIGIGTTQPEQRVTVNTGNIQVSDGWGWFKATDDTSNIALKLGQLTGNSNESLVDVYTNDTTPGSTSYNLDFHLKRYIHNYRFGRSSPAGIFNTTVLNSLGDSSNSYTRFNLYHQTNPATSTAGTLDVQLTTGTEDSFIRTGNVGIGISSPTNKLTVVNDSGFDPTTNTTNVSALKLDGAYGGGLTLEDTAYSGIYTQTNGTSMRLYVGQTVGSDTPQDKVVMTLNENGNVGIGTTIPDRKLDIIGTNGAQFRISNTTADVTLKNAYHQVRHYTNAEEDFIWALAQSQASMNTLYLGGSSSLGNAATNIQFYTATDNTTVSGTERMRIDSGGRVGIGTTDPSLLNTSLDQLVVGNGSTNQGIVVLSGTTAQGAITFYDTTIGGRILYDHADNSMTFATNGNNERVWITNAGAVGIGTDTPGELLEVNGNIRVGGDDAGPNYIAFRGTTGDNPGGYNHSFIGERIYDGLERSELVLLKGNDSNSVSGPDRIRLAAAALVFETYPDLTQIGGSSFENVATDSDLVTRMYITPAGNVGIGTTNPASLLHISSGTAGDAVLTLEADTDNNDEQDNPRIDFKQDGGVVTSRVGMNADNSLEVINEYADVNAKIILGTSNITRMTIDGAGNVGIGTINPQAKLHVEGAVRIDGAYEHNSATASLSTTTQTVIASWSTTTYGGGKVVIQAYDTISGDRQMSEMLVTHDGTNVEYTEYANISTGNTLATYIFDISGGNVRLLATSSSANSTQYKVVETLVLA